MGKRKDLKKSRIYCSITIRVKKKGSTFHGNCVPATAVCALLTSLYFGGQTSKVQEFIPLQWGGNKNYELFLEP